MNFRSAPLQNIAGRPRSTTDAHAGVARALQAGAPEVLRRRHVERVEPRGAIDGDDRDRSAAGHVNVRHGYLASAAGAPIGGISAPRRPSSHGATSSSAARRGQRSRSTAPPVTSCSAADQQRPGAAAHHPLLVRERVRAQHVGRRPRPRLVDHRRHRERPRPHERRAAVHGVVDQVHGRARLAASGGERVAHGADAGKPRLRRPASASSGRRSAG